MRILHVFPSFAIGGSQMRFATLVPALGVHYQHEVISLSGNYEASSLLSEESWVSYPPAPAPGPSVVKRLGAYRRLLVERSPDLLVTYNWGAIEWALANLCVGIPHLQMEDGFGPEEVKSQIRRRVWIRRLALIRSHLAAPSLSLQAIALNVWRFPSARFHYVPNGLDPLDRPVTRLESLNLNLDPLLPRVIWAGALRAEKNPIRMLQAFAPLAGRANLLVAGAGPLQAAMEVEIASLGIQKHVRLLGSRTDVRDLIMQCDVLALSSDTEQMPYVVLEAMDAGLPIASVDVGDVRQMVSEENRPLISPVGDRAMLSLSLERLLSSPAEREVIGVANRSRMRQLYSLKGMVEEYRSIFQNLAGARWRQG